jgi:hypothetical protein
MAIGERAARRRSRYVRNGGQNWQRDFPMRGEVEDYAGRTRPFVITCHKGDLGFTVRASEEGRGNTGYEFAAYSETSPYSALGRVREKMHAVWQHGTSQAHLATAE